ncbi:MAG: hypothetical protein ACRCUY_09045 [Thermoguttaceae bacterium]
MSQMHVSASRRHYFPEISGIMLPQHHALTKYIISFHVMQQQVLQDIIAVHSITQYNKTPENY